MWDFKKLLNISGSVVLPVYYAEWREVNLEFLASSDLLDSILRTEANLKAFKQGNESTKGVRDTTKRKV